MSLEAELAIAKKKVVADGYDMSIGEVINLYKDGELEINPEFQRLFRWDLTRKTRFIESVLLGIPIPPIFVYQTTKGTWELIDGLQRLSTILEFVGILRKSDKRFYQPSILEGTKFLPSLSRKSWTGDKAILVEEIGAAQQLTIKRARLRVEILKSESDSDAKFELFQRLNTGGAMLSEQEVRNCTAVMVNPTFYRWLRDLAANKHFTHTISQSDRALERQQPIELALRFFVYRNHKYNSRLDVHEYLDEAMLSLARGENFDQLAEECVFLETFELLDRSLGANSFKKWNGKKHLGQFLISVYEVVAIGVAENLNAITSLGSSGSKEFVVQKVRTLWANETFINNNGAGVRGTTRLMNLLPMAKSFFMP